MSDFETMPVGSAAIIDEMAQMLRAHEEGLRRDSAQDGVTRGARDAMIDEANNMGEVAARAEALLGGSHAASATGNRYVDLGHVFTGQVVEEGPPVTLCVIDRDGSVRWQPEANRENIMKMGKWDAGMALGLLALWYISNGKDMPA